jgi:hypothetical protein
MRSSPGEPPRERHDYIIETLVVRDGSGARTAQYLSLLNDMGMPP